MKININRIPFSKRSCLLVCFFACMFVFASFTKEDRQKVRRFKTDLISKWADKNMDSLSETSKKSTVKPLAKKEVLEEPSKKDLKRAIKPAVEEQKVSNFNNVNSANIISYPSKEKEGVIGTFTNEEQDRLSDNFFTIDIPSVDKGNSVAFLEYDLYGLASHQSVSRSINRNVAIGGNIIVPSAQWSHQREAVSADLIKNGINTVLFTSPADGVKYRIKNLKIVFDKDKKLLDNLIVSSTLSEDQLYVKGNNVASDGIVINNENISLKNGEFETMISLSVDDKAKGSFSITAEGVISHYKIPENTKSFKTLHNNYFNGQGISISKDQELNIDYEGMNLKVEKETSEAAYLEILKLRTKDYPTVSQGLKNVTLNNTAYRLSVVSGKLNKKVKLTIPYDEKRLGLVSPKDIKIFHFDYNKRQWVVDASAVVDTKTKTVTVEGDGDTDYIDGFISTPESPQTTSFAPTTISGLKAGDPTAGLVFMAPPSASQKGDATLSYPVVIPAGRNGLQPNLSITYNSGKGNGWMGEGWDINGLSMIELDTRWGAPEFAPDAESELYSLDGEMLVYPDNYLPHRHNDIPNGISTQRPKRNTTGMKVFHLRRNHDFSKIERYGNSPADYRWVITSINGIKTYYGGDEKNQDAQSVLKSSDGGISKWGIYKVEDGYGNNIKYYYDNSSVTGLSPENANLSGGRIFCVKSITYTGKDGKDGGYLISFDKETTIQRKDLYINAKQGIKYVEPYRLSGIRIYNKLDPQATNHFKSYHFFYTEGEFNKSLMNKFFVAEEEHYYNIYNLEYHDELKSGTTTLPAFGPDTPISTFQADSSLFTLPPGHNPAKINTTYTKEEGVTFRIGLFLDFVTTTQNAYGNIILLSLINGTSKANAKGAQQLVDFNGDGVPDILYKKSDGLYIRPGVLANDGTVGSFGVERMVQNMKSNFSYTETKTKSRGKDWGGSISFMNWSIFANTSNLTSSSKSITPTYLVDANSDGLMDIVEGKEVWFNKLTNGTPTFTKYSETTENMIIKGGAVNPTVSQMLPKDDVIKFWIAPKDGYIRFSDKISIENVNGANAVYSVEVPFNNGSFTRGYRVYLTKLLAGGAEQSINVSHYNDYFAQIKAMVPANNPHSHLALNNPDKIFVKSGEKVFIRLHQNEDKNYKVNSNPEIVYVDPATGIDLPNNSLEEQDGFNINNGSYADNFFLNNHDAGLKLSQPGSIKINVPLIHFNQLNDGVKLSFVVQNLVTNQMTELYSQSYPQSASGVNIGPLSLNATITDPSVVMCYVESLSHVAYKNTGVENITVSYTTGGSTYTLNLVPRYNTHYVKDLKPKLNLADYTSTYPSDPKTYSIQINKNIPLNSFNYGEDFSFTYVVKKAGQILGKRKIFVTHVNNIASLYEVDLATNQTISGVQPIPFFTGSFADSTNPAERISIQVYVDNARIEGFYKLYKGYAANKIFNIYTDQNVLLTTVPETSFNSSGYTQLSKIYKNWGQFLYRDEYVVGDNGVYSCITNGSCDEYGVLIGDVEEPWVNINTANCNNLDAEAMQSCIAQSSTSFMPNNVFPLTTLKLDDVEKWKGASSEQYSSALAFKDDEFTNTGLFNTIGLDVDPANIDDITVITPDSNMTKMAAADKIFYNDSKTNSYSGGASGNIGVGASMGYSESNLIKPPGSILVQDFMDLNGDGYPDLMTKDKIQLTLATGGHRAAQNAFVNDNITSSNNYQNAITLAANFNVKAFKSTGANAKTGLDRATRAQADNSAAWSAPVGISGNFNFDSKDYGEAYWLDVNGDGLIDRISGASDSGFNCSFNYGKGMYNPAPFKNSSTYSSHPLGSVGMSFGGALSGLINALAGLTMGFGVDISAGGSRSTGTSDKVLEDVNGDGLVDILTVNSGELKVNYNLGNKFTDQQVILKKESNQNINFSEELENFNGYGSIGGKVYIPFGPIPILPIPGMYLFNLWIKAGVDIAGNIGMTLSEVKKSFKDMNGDGYNDLVRYEGNDLIVNYSRIGKTNKLKKVSNEYSNSTFVIDYKYTQPNYEDPNARLVMSEVKAYDPDAFSSTYTTSSNQNDMVSRFDYGGSKYDRRERMHLGFEKVATQDFDAGNTLYRKHLQTFYNKSYHTSGLLKTSELYSNSDELVSKTENVYTLHKFMTGNVELQALSSTDFEIFDSGGKEGRRKAVALLTKIISTNYEDGNAIQNTKQMFYNRIGQLVKFQYTSPTFTYNSMIAYHSGLSNNNINTPKSINVYSGTTTTSLLRNRETKVNPQGDITQVKVKLNTSQFAITDLGYDAYGNIKWVMYPENEQAQRYRLDYNYDTVYNKYVVYTKNSFNEYSSAEYNTNFDVPTLITDIAGNTTHYFYDDIGRLTKIIGPKEQQLPPTSYYGRYTIMYSYSTVPITTGSLIKLYRANTLHYNADEPENPIETITFADGMGRVIQTKKDIQINGVERMSVSGATYFDNFGRLAKQYHPRYEVKASDPTNTLNSNNYLNPNTSISHYVANKYDIKDRIVKLTDEDHVDTSTYYKVDNGMLKTTVTVSSVGQQTETFANAEGRVVMMKTYPNGQALTTTYEYETTGQLGTVIDPEGHKTSYSYDGAGRRIRVVNEDHGDKLFEYDPAGNVIKAVTANLQADPNITQQYIKYKYDQNRLVEVTLPSLPNGAMNPNNAKYQYAAAGNGNNTGRLIKKEDGTGSITYEYGNLGEVLQENRTIYGYNVPTMYFKTKFSYDSWNRIRQIDYPDGEVLYYQYDLGGNLKSVINNDNYKYISNIGYDEYEQRINIAYGNGTKSEFTYYNATRRLSNHALMVVQPAHYLLYNNYGYDAVGNVVNLENTADVSPNQMGGIYKLDYYYDGMSRLRGAQGQFRMKVVKDEVTPPVPGWSPYQVSNSTFDLSMEYNGDGSIMQKTQKHEQDLHIAPNTTYDNKYEYVGHKVKQITDNNSGQSTGFEYDFNGNLTTESSSNGNTQMFWDEQDRMKAYYNDNAGVYQYYAYDDGGERTIKYNMSGGSQLYQNGAMVDPGTISLNDYKVYSSPRVVVTSDGKYSKHYFEGSRRFASRLIDGNDLFQTPTLRTASKTGDDKAPSPETDFKAYLEKAGLPDKISIELGGRGPIGGNSNTPGLYYLHGDHLGTATYVTDENAETTQFFLNLPYGETMAEQTTGVFDNPYKFNAKELDTETGLYYYGARYYNPKWSIWYGVDPMADKYRSWSPYNYTLDNPVTLTDPDGREPNGPGPKGTFGTLRWLKSFSNDAKLILPVDPGYSNVSGRNGVLSSLDGSRNLNVMQSWGFYTDVIERGKFDVFQPFNKANNDYAGGADTTTNCWGYVLTNGYFFVNNTPKEVIAFLQHSGYKLSDASSTTNFKVGDILTWNVKVLNIASGNVEEGGHIMEAVGKSKSGQVIWESFFGGDSVPIKGTLKEVMQHNGNIGGAEYNSLQNASLLRPTDTSKIKINDKKYESVSVKDYKSLKY